MLTEDDLKNRSLSVKNKASSMSYSTSIKDTKSSRFTHSSDAPSINF
jgi:hypothetical protein